MNSTSQTDKPTKSPTILDFFLQHEAETPESIFLKQPTKTGWDQYTWRQVGKESRKILASMQKLGLRKGDRVAILSQNCAAWVMCDIAIIMGGFISVPLYANVNATTMQDILNHSEARLLFAGKLHPQDWENQRAAIPSGIIVVGIQGYEKESVTSWDHFLAGDAENVIAPIPLPVPEDVFTIIYTSGTTGTPKGVVHTHGSVINALNVACKEVLLDQKGNRFFSYLPLSHAAERGLVEFGAIYSGGSISFAASQERFAFNIREAKPTHFFGVPRIWEKFQDKILQSLPQKKLNMLLAIPIASFLIKSKIKQSLGLDKADVLLTGAAPMSPELMVWFQKIGLPIREAYGMSENFNVCAMNPKNQIRIGSVGKLFDNQEVVIDPETQEIKQRCGWVMKGYYKDPEQTAITLRDGFLHTGDMGELSSDGFLKLTGRVKDIFKTTKGVYISPGKIELQFLSLPAIDQACVLGMKYPQPFVVAVLSEMGRVMKKEELTDLLESMLMAYNQSCMEYQKLNKVIIVKDEWTIDNGLLTPTFKMKRNSLAAKYEVAFGAIYNLDENVSWE